MENSENKKTPEELADEALDKVAGGSLPLVSRICPVCQEDKMVGLYYDPANPITTACWICPECASKIGYVMGT